MDCQDNILETPTMFKKEKKNNKSQGQGFELLNTQDNSNELEQNGPRKEWPSEQEEKEKSP
jgi:hypothetical protein